MDIEISQKQAVEDTPKACDKFKIENLRESLTPWKQRNGFCILPTHSTPPSGVLKVRNPFERGIIDRLHMSFCSPSVLVSSRKDNKENDKFEWTIDEISKVYPADIELCNSQFQIKNDPRSEHCAQKAINNFFKKDHIVLSPDLNVRNIVLPQDNPVKKCLTKTSCTQTVLTIPPKLTPELEDILKQFCTFTHDEQKQSLDSQCGSENESMSKKLFRDEYIIHISNEQIMDYSGLSPPPQSPALDLFISSKSKLNHGTPTFYNILSPSSISPIGQTNSPLRSSSISPISKYQYRTDNNDHEKTMISLPEKIPQACVSINSSYYLPVVESNTEYPFCQSTPERTTAEEKKYPVLANKNNIDESCSSPLYNQCFKEFQIRRHKSVTKLQFSDEDMSVDTSKLDYENEECRTRKNILNIGENMTGIFGTDDFAKCDIATFENGLVPLSPMQTSQMETPLKKRSASAKNLSRSFGLLPEKDFTNTYSENSSARVDSGFTESYNTTDNTADMTKHVNMLNSAHSYANSLQQCHNCCTVVKFNFLNYYNKSELKCAYCSNNFELL